MRVRQCDTPGRMMENYLGVAWSYTAVEYKENGQRVFFCLILRHKQPQY
jgi:hypothetical protein